jgi:hypothetical protein
VIASKKDEKEEINLEIIIFQHIWARGEDIRTESSRKQDLTLGCASSSDEVFKGV